MASREFRLHTLANEMLNQNILSIKDLITATSALAEQVTAMPDGDQKNRLRTEIEKIQGVISKQIDTTNVFMNKRGEMLNEAQKEAV